MKGRAAPVTAGQRYGRLLAVDISTKAANGSRVWRCTCECGRTAHVRASRLVNGTTRSCGCLRNEVAVELMRRVGLERQRALREARRA